VDKFVSTVATIVLELQFANTRIVDGGQDAARRFLDCGHLDGLDEAAPVAEVYRVLARPPCGEGGNRPRLETQRCERELRLTSTCVHLRHQGQIGRHAGSSLSVPR